jgi:tetratricopeptide (TPR) repeat protein
MSASSERWERLRALFDQARALPAGSRTAFLDAECTDTRLRAEVDALLRAYAALEGGAGAGFFLELDARRAAALLTSGGAVPASEDPGPGDTLGRYRIERPLAHGGMGVVYLAYDARLDRPAVLKLLPRHSSLDPAARRRFEEEARAASALDHPHIATVYDIGDAPDGRVFIAMAYYEGETLREEIERGPLPIPWALSLATQIADALAAAHHRGIVHRDVKPGNVIVTPDGVAKLVDFGIAKVSGSALTQPGATPGTVAYMSPEQTRGDQVDAGADVWALGVVLYEMLTGGRPFRGDQNDTVIFAIRHDEPEPPDRIRPEVPAGLGRVVLRCLAKDPADRYPDAVELRSDLERLPGRPARRRLARTVAISALATALVIAAALGGIGIRGSGTGGVTGRATAIAVIPPAPLAHDTALARLGRELTVTLTANLDGMGTIRTVPAVTVLALAGEGVVSLPVGASMARRLGATSVVHGTLVRAGPLVRLDAGLFATDDLSPLAHVTVTASPDDIAVLSDSATLMLLRAVWGRGEIPAPNLLALTTPSLTALRAYLEGEVKLAHGEYDAAVPAFERAFQADSTFWLAHWRSVYPRVYEGSGLDSATVAGMLAHRDRLPAPDRLLLDAYAAETLRERLVLFHTVTTRFPDYWPAWYDYGDALVHLGPYVGTTYADARAALERTVALSPDFSAAWWHLLWMTIRQRDVAAADHALAELTRFEQAGRWPVNPDNMIYFRALHGLLRSDGEWSAETADRVAGVALRVSPPVPPASIATLTLAYGFPRAQLQQAEAILRGRPPSGMATAQRMGQALAWAGRGAWDSAMVAADQWARQPGDSLAPLRAYGLAVVGLWAGAVEAEAVRSRRPEPSRLPVLQTADAQAELAWLDGIAAYVRGDRPALAASLRELRAGGAESADLLTASLEAFERHANGEHEAAARALARLEWEFADRDLPAPRRSGTGRQIAARFHPWLSAIHRPTAARWLLAAGDTLEAARLLTWHEAILTGDRAYPLVNATNAVVSPLALYERARLAEALGRPYEARAHYEAFLERYDLPPERHAEWVTEARTARARLPRALTAP